MFRSAAVALALLTSPTWATDFNGEVVSHQWNEVNRLCRQSEDSAGHQVSAEVSTIACATRETLAEVLSANGWCFDKGEYDWTATCPNNQARVEEPKFSDFPAPIYTGKVRKPVLDTADKRLYRTRINDAATRQPDFAGHFVRVGWGCGTSCRTGAVIDAKTGDVTFYPWTVIEPFREKADPKFNAEPISVRLDSRLFVVTGLLGEDGTDGVHYFEFDGKSFKPIPVACEPKQHVRVPKVNGLAYPQAREALISAGWQPYMDTERFDTNLPLMAAEKWIPETGFFEVDACSGTGMGFCRAHFIDKNWAWLRIITQSGDAGDHTVSSAFFVCDPS